MSTIMPEGKRVRDAVAWIEEERRSNTNLRELVDQAGLRFDLNPKEYEFLKKFFLEQEQAG